MMTLLAVKYLMRASGGPLIGWAALQATLVGWVAWYLVEASWSAAPLSASRTPLPPVTFDGAWIASLVTLIAAGSCIGTRMARGSWDGPDPTTTLPLRPGTHLLSAWASSVAVLGVVALAPVPIYVSLFDMGAFTPAAAHTPLFAHLAVIALGPLPGLALARAAHGRTYLEPNEGPGESQSPGPPVGAGGGR